MLWFGSDRARGRVSTEARECLSFHRYNVRSDASYLGVYPVSVMHFIDTFAVRGILGGKMRNLSWIRYFAVLAGLLPAIGYVSAQGTAVKITDVYIEKAIAVSGFNGWSYLVSSEDRLVFRHEGLGWRNGIRIEGDVAAAASFDANRDLIVHYRDTGVLDRITITGRERFHVFEDPIIGLADVGDSFAVALGGENPRIVLLSAAGLITDTVAEAVESGSFRSFFRNDALYFRVGARIVFRTVTKGRFLTRRASEVLPPEILGDPLGMDRTGGALVLSSGALFHRWGSTGEGVFLVDGRYAKPAYGVTVSTNSVHYTVHETEQGNTRVEWHRGATDAEIDGLLGMPGPPIGVWNCQQDSVIVSLYDGQPYYTKMWNVPYSGTYNPPTESPQVIRPSTAIEVDPEHSSISLDFDEVFRMAQPWDLPTYDIPLPDERNVEFVLLRRVVVDYATNTLHLEPNPYTFGTQTLPILLHVRGKRVYSNIAVHSPKPADPEVRLLGEPFLNRQTGLLEQVVRVTNHSGRGLGAFRLTFAGLPEGAEVYNRSGTDANGNGVIEYQEDLDDGESTTLIIEYLNPGRGPVGGIVISSESLPKSMALRDYAGGALAIDRMLRMDDGAILLEFHAEAGATYQVYYRSKGPWWLNCRGTIRAAGPRVQWIDNGPPKTGSHPRDSPSRLYRIRKLTAD